LPGAGIDLRPPRRLRETRPVYPDLLRAQGIEADVELLVSIDADGRVVAVKVIRPSRWAELDRAAREAAWRDRYAPATRNGLPLAYTLAFTTRFRLEAR
jgi:protein TonB